MIKRFSLKRKAFLEKKNIRNISVLVFTKGEKVVLKRLIAFYMPKSEYHSGRSGG